MTYFKEIKSDQNNGRPTNLLRISLEMNLKEPGKVEGAGNEGALQRSYPQTLHTGHYAKLTQESHGSCENESC